MVGQCAARHFRAIKIGVSGDFLVLSYQFVLFFCFQLFASFLKRAFFKKGVQKLGFSIFGVLSLNFCKFSFSGLLKHYKNRGVQQFFGFFVVEREENRQKK